MADSVSGPNPDGKSKFDPQTQKDLDALAAARAEEKKIKEHLKELVDALKDAKGLQKAMYVLMQMGQVGQQQLAIFGKQIGALSDFMGKVNGALDGINSGSGITRSEAVEFIKDLKAVFDIANDALSGNDPANLLGAGTAKSILDALKGIGKDFGGDSFWTNPSPDKVMAIIAKLGESAKTGTVDPTLKSIQQNLSTLSTTFSAVNTGLNTSLKLKSSDVTAEYQSLGNIIKANNSLMRQITAAMGKL